MRAGDGLGVVGCGRGPDCDGRGWDGGRADGGEGRTAGGYRPVRGDPQRSEVLPEEPCESLSDAGVRHRRLAGLPSADLPDAYLQGVGEGLLRGLTGRHAGGLQPGVGHGGTSVVVCSGQESL